MKFYGVEVVEREELGSYTLVRYCWSDGPVEPGQFVMARAAGYPATLDPFLARPFSYYDYDGNSASLLFEVRGRGTALLNFASTIEVTAPLGKGFHIDPKLGRAALLGGGIGVAPLKILSRRLDAMEVPHDVFLGFADAGQVAVAGEFPGAGVATMDGMVGTHGTVLDAIDSLEEYGAIYACGPNPMLAAVKLAAGEKFFLQVSREGRMGGGDRSLHGG